MIGIRLSLYLAVILQPIRIVQKEINRIEASGETERTKSGYSAYEFDWKP